MGKQKTYPISARATAEQRDQLRQIAEDLGVTVSHLLLTSALGMGAVAQAGVENQRFRAELEEAKGKLESLSRAMTAWTERVASLSGHIVVTYAADLASRAGVDYVDLPREEREVWLQRVIDRAQQNADANAYVCGDATDILPKLAERGIREKLAEPTD